MAVTMCYFTEFSCYPGASRKSVWRYTDTFCSRNVAQRIKFLAVFGILFIAIFTEVTENECVMHRRSHMSCWLLLKVGMVRVSVACVIPSLHMGHIWAHQRWRAYNKALYKIHLFTYYYNITYSLLFSKSTRSLILPWWNFCKLPLPLISWTVSFVFCSMCAMLS